MSPLLLPEDENAIQRALERQVKYWQDMLFGWRRPDQYLWPRDQLSVALLRSLGLLLVFTVIGVALALLAYGWWRALEFVVGNSFLGYSLQFQRPARSRSATPTVSVTTYEEPSPNRR